MPFANYFMISQREFGAIKGRLRFSATEAISKGLLGVQLTRTKASLRSKPKPRNRILPFVTTYKRLF